MHLVHSSTSHGTNSERTPEPRLMPPCKPPPSRPPVTPSVDDLPTGNNSSGGGGSSSGNTLTNASNNGATPTARQSKAIRPSGTLPQALAGSRRVQPPVPPVPPPQAVTSLHSSNDSGFSNEPPVQPDVDYSDDEAMRQRRRKTRAERIAEADQAKVREEQSARKDWENDSWKTIPRDEKSWQLYKSAMDLWADVNLQSPCNNDKAEPARRWTSNVADGRRFEREERDIVDQSPRREHGPVKREKKYERTVRDYEYEVARERPNPNQRSKFSNAMDQSRDSGRRAARRNVEAAETRTRTRNREEVKGEEEDEDVEEEEEEEAEETEEEEEEEEEVEVEEDVQRRRHREKDAYDTSGQYLGKYEGKKYYNGDNVDGQDQSTRRGGYQAVERDERKYANDKSSSSDSGDESTITIPQTGRKVEHIAQKLEQTAQKYAREHSPPKAQTEKRSEYKEYEGREAAKARYDKYLEKERAVQRYERERYFEKAPPPPPLPSYERERATFEKNPDRNRNVERRSSRRFERPRPPFEEAPERPDERAYRERRYSDREEIYGETGRYARDPEPLDKERGYESNFETKLERNKVIEKHSYQKIDPRTQSPFKADKTGQKIAERNDTSDGTLKNERKLPSRQNTAVGHLIQTGRNFEIDAKSPKLVKRTKSFWRFRRDSDVLEGMALWQHRSLVDIPKMIRKEEKEEPNKANGPSGKSSPEVATANRGSDKERATTTATTTMAVADRIEEPKPAERMRVPDRNDRNDRNESFDDFPTPAERPKATERSERSSSYFVGNVSRKAILENERKRSLEAKQNMVVAELKENNEVKRSERRKKTYGDDDDGLFQNFTETEASDEESTYSCIVVKDQVVAEKTLLPRTKLRRDANRNREKNTCGPWYDLWGVDSSVKKKKKKQQ